MTRTPGVGTLTSFDAVRNVCLLAVVEAVLLAEATSGAVRALRGVAAPTAPVDDAKLPGWLR